MKNLFIDTNIFLSFYHFTQDDLEELRKLTLLVNQGEIQLFLPRQVIDEFNRNRANKVADAIKHLQECRISFRFPQISKDYPQFSQLRELQREFSLNHSKLIEEIKDDYQNNKLKADEVVQELFEVAKKIDYSLEIVEKAEFRIRLGNPPGKNNSLGDAINWETILKEAPEFNDFFIITDDKDFYSCMCPTDLDPFLKSEWESKTYGKIQLYKQISQFFAEHYPRIELETEVEKDKLINEFTNSGSFANTHTLISKLSHYSEFTDTQKEQIAYAAATNDQIYWIIQDEDVKNFLINTIKDSSYSIDYKIIQKLNDHFGEEVFDAFPF